MNAVLAQAGLLADLPAAHVLLGFCLATVHLACLLTAMKQKVAFPMFICGECLGSYHCSLTLQSAVASVVMNLKRDMMSESST